MYQVLLIALVGIMSLTSLVISGLAIAWIWGIKSSLASLSVPSNFEQVDPEGLDDMSLELAKINKQAETAFNDEFTTALERRSL